MAQLYEYKKKFIIIGNKNAITYKEIFSLIKSNKLWTGNTPFGKDLLFDLPEWFAEEIIKNKKEGSGYKIINGVLKARSQSIWFTNLDHKKRHELLDTGRKYKGYENMYPRYDNYDAINVDKVSDIPMDYKGYMGVPITFLDKYNPEQFEMIGIMNTGEKNEGIRYENTEHGRPLVNGIEKYLRILIKKKRKQ